MATVSMVKDTAGLDKIVLAEPLGATAEVYLHGGQVTSWKNERGEEQLFLSSKAVFKPPKAIRGGIPVCFPQFSNTGMLEQHGFARNRIWAVETDAPPIIPTSGSGSSSGGSMGSDSSKAATTDLVLRPSEDDLKIWPHRFEMRMRVQLRRGGDLVQTVRVRNTDTKPLTFTFALHTYFRVSDINEVRIEGLETLDYLDNLQERKRFTEQGDAITFDGELDRFYLGAPTSIAVIDHEKKRTLVVKKEGMPDAVVWNPWDKKAKAMTDFGDDEYLHMVCVEPAIFESAITLKPGEEWKGRQALSSVLSSYCSGQLDPNKVKAALAETSKPAASRSAFAGMTSRGFGVTLLLTSLAAYSYYAFWVIIIPFIDADHFVHAYFPERKYAVLMPAIGIALLIFGLTSFIAVTMLLACSNKKKMS